jgi:hypothetical protein
MHSCMRALERFAVFAGGPRDAPASHHRGGGSLSGLTGTRTKAPTNGAIESRTPDRPLRNITSLLVMTHDDPPSHQQATSTLFRHQAEALAAELSCCMHMFYACTVDFSWCPSANSPHSNPKPATPATPATRKHWKHACGQVTHKQAGPCCPATCDTEDRTQTDLSASGR